MNAGIKMAAAAVAGAGVGYILARVKLQESYEVRLREQAAEAREFYKDYYARKVEVDREIERDFSEEEVHDILGQTENDPEPVTPVPGTIVDYAARAMVNYSGAVNEVNQPAERPAETRPPAPGIPVKPAVKSAWAPEATAPVVISFDEFNQNNSGYTQFSLTWYAGDDILADDSDRKIANVDEMIGVRNLGKFGGISEDPNVVFIRNADLKAEYEVTRSAGAYSAEVLGEDPSPMA